MDPARAFRFPAVRTPSSITPSSAGSSASSPTSPITPGTEIEPGPKSPTLSTISTLVARKSFGADSVAGMLCQKISSTVLRPSLPGNHSVDWTMSGSPPNTTGISASRSCSGLVKIQNDVRHRRGIARSVTGPITQFFHLNGEDEEMENEDGWDFICCGEAPCRPERRAGWLGTLDFDEETTKLAPANSSVPLATTITASPDAISALGSPWSPDNKWGKALDPAAASLHPGGSPPALASPGWSPASGEGPLLSPSSFSSFRGHYFGLPGSPLPSLEAVHAMYSTPPQRIPSKGFAVQKAGPTRRIKVSIDSISAPIIADFNNIQI
ncbi:uncharacterized protein MELLADRAFT_60803 [Melampsora larici-populina 98AG31]|uniref:Uncharacterized protein n=1 Tax=Melampsora larici-populina (strain 98AG31 / pathotype 3-4-7) TaxID=747676 RepID=F4RCE3_MELLP|nr:uncharacterized protein MELLADRAFT_60803 [Melampsora larici-populina 98AG31]EGG09975.1 hypothetical protein MELLADRAFT_60803 [Melampsora larici-populina 98AG31]